MNDIARQLAARIDFYRELGVYDFYRRSGDAYFAELPTAEVAAPGQEWAASSEPVSELTPLPASETTPLAQVPPTPAMPPEPISSASKSEEPAISRRRTISTDEPVPPLGPFGPILPPSKRPAALDGVRELIGDCHRCRLAEGRNKIVFGVGDPAAQLMFVGEGPGADEDAQGKPFVGRAGQLLNNMIAAMGLKREQVYIANIVKCRPPQNRKPEPDEAHTCFPFLERQIEIVRPRIIVALGATAATYLLDRRGSIGSLRGRTHLYRDIPTVVTYHPAYLLRDPTQKKEAWKDLQMAMSTLGLKPPARATNP